MTATAVDKLSESELLFTLRLEDGTELANACHFYAWSPETQTTLVQETRNVAG